MIEGSDENPTGGVAGYIDELGNYTDVDKLFEYLRFANDV